VRKVGLEGLRDVFWREGLKISALLPLPKRSLGSARKHDRSAWERVAPESSGFMAGGLGGEDHLKTQTLFTTMVGQTEQDDKKTAGIGKLLENWGGREHQIKTACKQKSDGGYEPVDRERGESVTEVDRGNVRGCAKFDLAKGVIGKKRVRSLTIV